MGNAPERVVISGMRLSFSGSTIEFKTESRRRLDSCCQSLPPKFRRIGPCGATRKSHPKTSNNKFRRGLPTRFATGPLEKTSFKMGWTAALRLFAQPVLLSFSLCFDIDLAHSGVDDADRWAARANLISSICLN